MEKRKASSLFVNDGSFMERFKQLQQKEQISDATPKVVISGVSSPSPLIAKSNSASKLENTQKNTSSSSGKLAFSLKQKSKLVAAPVKLGGDDDDDEGESAVETGDGQLKRPKLSQSDGYERSSAHNGVPPFPSDPTVKNVADKLAIFVAKNGRHFENVTRQKNPGDTPFKFLFDESCADYKYYAYRLTEEEGALAQTNDSKTSHSGANITSASKSNSGSQRSHQQRSNYQIPASALYEATDVSKHSFTSVQTASEGRIGESSGVDPLAMMEYYAKKAAHEERRRGPKHSKDEMPPPASLHALPKRGHHMGDYIPEEELVKFMSNCNDVAAQKAAKEAADRAKIQADNVGHKLLSKMGWKEGEGLGSSKSGMSDPLMAGDVKKNNLGVGAVQPGEVTPDDDIYEQYKKRMMLGYKFRPNPMNNPRKSYY